jgi:hypothetical protein
MFLVFLAACQDEPLDTEVVLVLDTAPLCEANEVACDGEDDDCDGEIDEGLLVAFYVDEDGDGIGGDTSEERCPTGTAGWVTSTGDCDDADRSVFPGASELCNGVDDNCDGEADEGLEPPRWYTDADADGYGLEDDYVDICVQPQGTSHRAGDCDDGDPDINPGAFETCGDEVDNDCDAAVDDVSVCCVATTDDTDQFLLCTDAVPWADARDACAADGWSLMVPQDSAQNTWLAGLVEWHGSNLWLGLTDAADEGVWLTTDGNAASWYGWKSSEPNNYTGTNPDGQDCAGFVFDSMAWHDLDCDGSQSFVCEE